MPALPARPCAHRPVRHSTELQGHGARTAPACWGALTEGIPGRRAGNELADRPHPSLPQDHSSLASLSQGTCPGLPLPSRLSSPLERTGRDSALRPRSARPRVPPAAASPRPSRRSAPRPPRGSTAGHPARHRAQSVAQGAPAAPGFFRVGAAAIRRPPPPARHVPAPGWAQGCQLQLPTASALPPS